MHKGFTLIEVLIAVVIISVVGLGLLQAGANNTKLIHHMDVTQGDRELFSLALLSADIENHGKRLDFYETVRSKFALNDAMITHLKAHSYQYYHEEHATIDFMGGFLSIIKGFLEEQGKEDQLENLENLYIRIDKVSMHTDKSAAHGYTIQVLEE